MSFRNYYTHPETEQEKADKKLKHEQDMAHIEKVLATRRRLGGITNSELLGMDYRSELKNTPTGK